MTVLTLAGRNRDGAPFGTFLLDSTAGGGGAFIDHDGLDGSGDYVVPRPAIANVETNEAAGPYLYLFRSFVCDSGGPGRMRGGVGSALALAPHDVDGLAAMMLGHGIEVPNSIGLFGGRPGSCGRNFLRRGLGDAAAMVAAAGSLKDLDHQSVDDLGPKPGNLMLGRRDVIGYSFQGGGGYGDPLLRDAARVAEDVANGLVSVEAAKRDYGVVLSDGVVDKSSTAQLRQTMRSDRLGYTPTCEPPVNSERLPDVRVSNGRFVSLVGYDLGPCTGNWKAQARVRVVPPENYGPLIRLHPELEIREFICPASGLLLEIEVARKGQPALISFQLSA
jgi:N-methylhydantoinase B